MPSRLSFRPVTPANSDDFTALFEGPGGPKYCWCMAWRPLEGKRMESGPRERREVILSTIAARTPVGILAYDEGRPVGWCSVAPRETYLRLGGPEDADTAGPIWSIVCFYLRRNMRGEGLGRALLHAAIDYAGAEGARTIEAYPVAPDSPSYRFMGFVPMYESAGFKPIAKAGKRRTVMRLMVAR